MDDMLKVLKEMQERFRTVVDSFDDTRCGRYLEVLEEADAIDQAITIMEVVAHPGFRELRYHTLLGSFCVRIFKNGSYFGSGSGFPTKTEALAWAHRMLFPDKEG